MQVIIKNRERYQINAEMCLLPPPEKILIIPMRAVREGIEMSKKEFAFVKEKYSGSLIVRQQA